MAKIQLMVEGGKATPSPQLAQTLGPMKIPIQEVIMNVNAATKAFAGVKVPVQLIVNEKTKSVSIEVGSPPTSELIKKELGLEKGSGTPHKSKVGNIAIEQLVKIAKMKMSAGLERTLKSAIKTVAGSCNSLGVLCEGKPSHDFTQDLDAGVYDTIVSAETTEFSAEKKQRLAEQLTTIQAELEKMFAKVEEVAPVADATTAPAETKERDAKSAATSGKVAAPAETKTVTKEAPKKK